MANKKRLIDANGKQTINAVNLTGFILCFSDGIISVIDRFGSVACEFYAEDIPTVDAVEVVHGWWDKYEDDKFIGYDANDRIKYRKVYIYYCGRCGRGTAAKTNYCPNCGADMRERKDDA